MIVVPYTFQCKELLFVLGRMLPPPDLSEGGEIRDAAAQIANTLSRNVQIVDNQELLVEMDEPVEALAIARELELRVARCIASPLALELVRESGEPARASWEWLRTRLGLRTEPGSSLVKLVGIDRDRLPDNVDQIPDGSGVLLWILGNPDQVVFVNTARTIGRTDEADIVVADDPSISRIHATIIPYEGTWAIHDNGSSHGTKIDGRFSKTRCLVPGMTIELAHTRVVVLSVR